MPILTLALTLTQVRGYKTIVRFVPHEVADLEPLVRWVRVRMTTYVRVRVADLEPLVPLLTLTLALPLPPTLTLTLTLTVTLALALAQALTLTRSRCSSRCQSTTTRAGRSPTRSWSNPEP